MRALPQVTLCCVDTVNHALALRALQHSQLGIDFGRVALLTHAMPATLPAPGIDIVEIGPLASRTAYSEFMLKGLRAHVQTSHALVVQWDGFVVNPAAWNDAFLDCDYLGAKWFWYDSMRVGNGGFSLRSRRLLEALQDPRIQLVDVEDLTICRTFRPLLALEHGIRFGSEDLADRFAFEGSYPIGKPFGFHGLFNFCRVLDAREIAALVPLFSDAIVRSLQAGQLLRNCAALEQWEAVLALAERMLALDPDEPESRALLQRARDARSRPRAVGRNEPCPCGSGRKYKQCHGALDGSPATTAPVAPASRPLNVDDSVQHALAAHQRGDLDTAERLYRTVLATATDHPVATHYLGVAMYQRGNPRAALPYLERAAATRPEEPEFHSNHGLALAALQRHEEAIVTYRRTLALKADHAVAWNNLGLSLAALNRFADAIAAYREAIARAPQFGQAHWNLALALLSIGAYEEGWREYDWRLLLQELGKRTAPPDVPRWDGTLRPGLRVLLTTEQGLGDTVQFARFATLLATRGVWVAIEASPRWHALLRTVPGVAAVRSSDARVVSDVDAYLALLSVPRALRLGEREIAAAPYLGADPTRRAGVRALLQDQGAKLRVGVSWAGSPAHGYDARRSITPDTLAPLLAVPGVAWVSLQKDARIGSPWIELDARNDLDDTAALIAELDVVISVDTSIAHLAGAMGRPLWVVLPFAADWRWGHDRSDSPWYPSARLFRQPRPGDWPAVMGAVREALEERLASAPR